MLQNLSLDLFLSVSMATAGQQFQSFFDNWLSRHEALLQDLHRSIAPENIENIEQQRYLIAQVLSHYKHYYEEKFNAARQDAFLFLNPPWLTSLERTLLWLGEFKPLIIFRLISNAVTDLTPEQRERIEEVKAETRCEERALTETLARIQESIASPHILNLARRFGRLIDGQVSEMEAAVEMLKASMLAVLQSADGLRGSTAVNVVNILSPVQAVRFLAAALEFQLRIRTWGQSRDSQRLAGVNGVAA